MIEQQVRDIAEEARAQARHGQLTEAGLQRAIDAGQQFIDFLDALLEKEQLVTGTFTDIDSIANDVAERIYRYDS